MTLLTLITINAVLAAAAVYGIVLLLGHGIRSNEQHAKTVVHRLPAPRRDRLAA